jgi:cysteine desulfurase
MSRAPIYLDHHATTPVDARVLEAMLPFFSTDFGNAASSTHQWGWRAHQAVDQARQDVARLLGATAREVVFTSGATESNNTALHGAAAAAPSDRRRLVISSIEHKSVLEPARRLAASGWDLQVVPVLRDGLVDMEALDRAIDKTTALVSVMAANNEIGVLQPVAAIGALARERGALFHVDAAQAAGKVPIDVTSSCIDLLSFTAHKLYGPKGTGALFIRRRLNIEPLLWGGGHERGMRAGTLNVPGIVGFGVACALARVEMTAEAERVGALRDRLLHGLQASLGGVVVNGSLTRRLPNNLHVSFEDVDGESLMIGIGDIAVSSGSACSSASAEPSHVLAALAGGAPVASATVRFGLGRSTTAEEIDYTIEKFVTVVRHLRAVAPAPHAVR